MVQECYRFINGNVIFDLSRYLQLPAESQASDYNSPLPAFEALTPFDDENKWILMISVRVANGKIPDQTQQAVSELITTKDEFEGCFNFHIVDRLTMDTRTKMTWGIVGAGLAFLTWLISIAISFNPSYLYNSYQLCFYWTTFRICAWALRTFRPSITPSWKPWTYQSVHDRVS